MRAVMVAGLLTVAGAAHAQDVGTKLVTGLNQSNQFVGNFNPPFKFLGSSKTPQGVLVFLSARDNRWLYFTCHPLDAGGHLCQAGQTLIAEARIIP